MERETHSYRVLVVEIGAHRLPYTSAAEDPPIIVSLYSVHDSGGKNGGEKRGAAVQRREILGCRPTDRPISLTPGS